MVSVDEEQQKATNMEPKAKQDQFMAEITAEDKAHFKAITNQKLTAEQAQIIRTPPGVYPKEKTILAVHWHPEFIPIPLIKERIEATFPNATEHLIIPTQHNQLMVYDDYAGVEVDCYSPEFNTKVQLLLHFHPSKLENATVLRSMLEHTFNYRGGQLFNFLHALTSDTSEFVLQKAAAKTGANTEVVRFVTGIAKKLLGMIESAEVDVPKDAIKNKLIRNYLDQLRTPENDEFINRSQIFLNAVKNQVKQEFDLSYFYTTQEIIEETRGLGGCIVIPHPEQFWPILLADYDVDGIEIWNPQSRRYTDFLINVVDRQNKSARANKEPLLIFMGDDTHFGEKTKVGNSQNRDKVTREVGVQPPWNDLAVKKTLIQARSEKLQVIARYKERLNA